MDTVLFFFRSLDPAGLIMDAVLLLIVLVFAVLGARRGMVLTLCSLASVVLAFLGGGYLADLLTPPLVKQAAPMLESTVQEYLTSLLPSADAAAEKGGFLWNLLRGLMEDGIASAESMTADLAAALAESVIHPIVFLLGFVLILILCWFIGRALDLVARLPVLHSLNALGGFLLGTLKGGLLVVILVPLILRFWGGSIPAGMVEGSHILKYIDQLPHFF